MFDYFDPDMVMGYNTSTFDYPYLIGRFERNDISVEDIPNTGRLLRDKSSIFKLNWSSSGAGKNNITFLRHKGRIPFDLLPNIRRLYKLRKYTMDYVCRQYLKDKDGNPITKHDVSAKEMFLTYEAMQRGDPGAIERMTKVVAYCIQDSVLPILLFDNRKLWFHLSSLSSAAGVSILELFTRGEQIRCYSNIADECYKQGIVLSNPQYFDYYYKGGFVAKPSPGVYKYVFTLDFSSLYPSIMQGYNLSIDSIIKIEDWPKFSTNTCESIEFDQEEPVDALSASYRKDLEDKYKLYLKYMQTGDQRYYVKFTQDDLSTLYTLGRTEIKRYNFTPENSNEDIDFEPEDLTMKQTVIRRYEIRVIKKVFDDGTPGYEGIMPLLERTWVGERKIVKKEMKKCEDIDKYKDYKKEDYDKVAGEIEELKAKIDELENEHGQTEENGEVTYPKKIAKELNKLHETLAKKLFIYELRNFTKDDFDKNKSLIYVYDASQKAVKVMANSGYGFNGVPNGMLPALPVAICVTALGRKLIGIANEVLTKKFAHLGAKVVYNDTDSSMVCLDIKEEDVLSGKINLEAIAEEMEDTINGRKEEIIENDDGTITVIPGIEPVFRDPLKMECENCCQMCPLKPKYYIKAHREMNLEKIKKNGPFKLEDGKPEITTKGILTSKKGNAQFSNIVYDDLVNKVIFMKHTAEMLYALSKHICNFLSDRFDVKDLCRVTELGANYANENYFMNVFANNLTKLGMPVKPGERLEYIIVRTAKELMTGHDENVGEKCREYSMWEADPNKESIDYCYYIENGLQEQFDFLFYVGNMNVVSDPRLADLGYKPQFLRCQGVHFGSPIKMISSLIRDYMKLNDQDFYNAYVSYGLYYDMRVPRNHHIAVLLDIFISRICNRILQFYPYQESI